MKHFNKSKALFWFTSCRDAESEDLNLKAEEIVGWFETPKDFDLELLPEKHSCERVFMEKYGYIWKNFLRNSHNWEFLDKNAFFIDHESFDVDFHDQTTKYPLFLERDFRRNFQIFPKFPKSSFFREKLGKQLIETFSNFKKDEIKDLFHSFAMTMKQLEMEGKNNQLANIYDFGREWLPKFRIEHSEIENYLGHSTRWAHPPRWAQEASPRSSLLYSAATIYSTLIFSRRS